MYVRDTSVVSPYALLLFGGAIDVQHTQKLISLDGWIRFRVRVLLYVDNELSKGTSYK